MTSTAPRIPALTWVGWVIIVLSALGRALASFDEFPYWSIDPMRLDAPVTGLTPATTLIADLVVIVASALVLLAERRAIRPLLPALGLVGLLGVMVHAVVLHPASIDHARLGMTWAASILGCIAIVAAARHERLLRLTASLCLGVVALLVARAAVQVFVEHAQTVRQFRASPETFLMSQGITPGSTSAMLFERRMNQPEGTAWFGLSNVMASFMAALLAIFLGAALSSLHRTPNRLDRPSDGWIAMLVLGAILAAAGLYLTGSKGGFVAAFLGAGLIVVALLARTPWATRRPIARLGGLFGLALVASALLAILARGLVGESLGERSILFRWFYLVGAARVTLAEFPWGTGPAGFKEAYTLLKPPLSPEEVTSPHSVLFDFAATLGVAGLAWCAAFILLVYRCGRALLNPPATTPTDPAAPSSLATGEARADARIIVGLASLLAIGTLQLERAILSPEGAAARVLGLIIWIALAMGLMAWLRTWVGARTGRPFLAAGALALAVHAQIEVTPIWPGSAPLAWLLLALGAALSTTSTTTKPAPTRLSLIVAALIACAALLSRTLVPATLAWERALAHAAQETAPLRKIWTRLDELQASGGSPRSGDTMARIAADLGDAINQFPPTNDASFQRAMNELTARVAAAARPAMERAIGLQPLHLRTRESASRLAMAEAGALSMLGRAADARSAADTAERMLTRDPRSRDFGWDTTHANLLLARAELESRPELARNALELLIQDAAGDPHGTHLPVRIATLAQRLGQTDIAATWARAALDRDELQRLDPLRRLSESDRARLTAIAKPAASPNPGN